MRLGPGNHKLRIETGKHDQVQGLTDSGLFVNLLNEIEDESHFLIYCIKYSILWFCYNQSANLWLLQITFITISKIHFILFFFQVKPMFMECYIITLLYVHENNWSCQ